MSDVEIPYGSNPSETATLLLAAAEDLDLDPQVVVRTSGDGFYVVPQEVADEAGLSEDGEESEQKAPAKKTAAKKTAAKKS